jgi:hypothetical protein
MKGKGKVKWAMKSHEFNVTAKLKSKSEGVDVVLRGGLHNPLLTMGMSILNSKEVSNELSSWKSGEGTGKGGWGFTSTALVPTSMTAAPGLIQSAFTTSGFPTAAMTMSAVAQICWASWERECSTVTVASLFVRSIATGVPTMLLRPTTTALLPEISTPALSRSSRQPCVGQGTPDRESKKTFW